MPIHITMSDASKIITDWALSRQNLTEERKAQIYKAEKYNVLTKLFNASSLLLTAGVVSAFFLAMSSAFVFLVLGLFLRITTEKEIKKYTLPVQLPQPEAPSAGGIAARGWQLVRDAFQTRQTRLLEHALDQTTVEAKAQNIFDNVKLERQNGFIPDEVLLSDFSMWKNSITIPEVVVQRRVEEGVRQEEPAPPPPQPAPQQNNANAGGGGIFANLVGRVMGSGAATQPLANTYDGANQ